MSTAERGVSREHIVSTPGVCGGRPCIAGTRIRVLDVFVMHEKRGRSADEIVAEFPQLTPADVYAAMAYAWDNRAAIVQDYEEEKALYGRLKDGPPTAVDQKLKAYRVA